LEKLVKEWLIAEPTAAEQASEYYCDSRTIFQSRLDRLTSELSQKGILKDNLEYLISAVVGEIGNNSFDHNIGNWPDVKGVFFGSEMTDDIIRIILADRGLGLFATLKRVKPELSDDKDAMRVGFIERISGRAPEPRGNGLKFVRESVRGYKMHLTFYSGYAKGDFNEDMVIIENTEKIAGCMAILTLNI